MRKNVLVIISWDIELNMEVNTMQFESLPNEFPEYFVVRGLNLKYNYFVSVNNVFDLEHNLPRQTI